MVLVGTSQPNEQCRHAVCWRHFLWDPFLYSFQSVPAWSFLKARQSLDPPAAENAALVTRNVPISWEVVARSNIQGAFESVKKVLNYTKSEIFSISDSLSRYYHREFYPFHKKF